MTKQESPLLYSEGEMPKEVAGEPAREVFADLAEVLRQGGNMRDYLRSIPEGDHRHQFAQSCLESEGPAFYSLEEVKQRNRERRSRHGRLRPSCFLDKD